MEIMSGTETKLSPEEAKRLAKFVAKQDKALAIVVLSVDTTFLYLLGDPVNLVKVWKTLGNHFQKSWANKLELRRKLYSLKMKEGEPVQRIMSIR